MSDLIRREDAINAMAELQGIAQSKAELTGISKAWKRIKALPAASPWHRVKNGLPEIGQIVLVYDEWCRLSICQLDYSYRWLRQGGGWFNGSCACYWMPIEPPKEDADANE